MFLPPSKNISPMIPPFQEPVTHMRSQQIASDPIKSGPTFVVLFEKLFHCHNRGKKMIATSD